MKNEAQYGLLLLQPMRICCGTGHENRSVK